MIKDRVIAFIIALIVAVLFGVIVKTMHNNTFQSGTGLKSSVESYSKSSGNSSNKIHDDIQKNTFKTSNQVTLTNNRNNLNTKKQDTDAYVLVSDIDIKQGAMIKSENFRWDLWPKKNVSDAYIAKDINGNYLHPSLTMESLIGLSAKINIPKNSPITKGFLLEGEIKKESYSLNISPGQRAVSVPVDQMSVKNSVFAPNDFVDVYFDNKTKVMRNIRILALDNFTNKISDYNVNKGKIDKLPQTVTLELSPKKVDYLLKHLKGAVVLVMVSNEETHDIKEAEDISDYTQPDSDFENMSDDVDDKKMTEENKIDDEH